MHCIVLVNVECCGLMVVIVYGAIFELDIILKMHDMLEAPCLVLS